MTRYVDGQHQDTGAEPVAASEVAIDGDRRLSGVSPERPRREPDNPRAVDWYDTKRGVRVIIALGGEDLVVDEKRARALHHSLAIALAEIDGAPTTSAAVTADTISDEQCLSLYTKDAEFGGFAWQRNREVEWATIHTVGIDQEVIDRRRLARTRCADAWNSRTGGTP